jgi:hypothetical protein
MGFSGYAPDALALLDRMGAATKAEAAQLKPRIDTELTEPTRELVEAVGAGLQERISDGIQAVPRINGSISPFHRDLRFTDDRDHPLKDHVHLVFWEGTPKSRAATLRIRITSSEVGFAATTDLRDRVPRWRELVASDAGAALGDAITAARRSRRFLALGDPELKTVPKGYDPDHPRADLLRRRSLLLAGATAHPKIIHGPRFVDWCARRLDALAGVHRWAVEHLVG